jgi:hypothetical protein
MPDASPPVTVRIASGQAVSLTPDQDYQVRYRVPGVQRKDRYTRMGFAGAGRPWPGGQSGAELVFSARGPDRTHSGQYGATQTLRAEWILDVRQVANDPAKRYVGDYFAPPRGCEAEAKPPRLLPQHLADDGAWCTGSGRPPLTETGQGVLCSGPGCTARLATLGPNSNTSRLHPDGVLEAALAYGVRALLKSGPNLLPRCGVPLDPEPESITVAPAGDPYSTVVTVTYPGGDTHRVWVTVETQSVIHTHGARQ